MANINNSKSDTVISGDYRSANSIYNYGDNVTINGANYWGDHYIENHGSGTIIFTGRGYDEIQNYGADSSIHGGAQNDIIYNYEDATNSTLVGGTGDDEIRNYAANTYIDGNEGNDVIRDYGSNTFIDTDGGSVSGSNSVSAFASNVTVNVNGGNDTVSAYAGDGTVILGGIRNDKITLVREFSTNNGVIARVNAGRGNDVITGSEGADIFQYTDNDAGDDIIYGYDENDTIELISNIYRGAETLDNNDVVLHVGYGSITLKDAGEKQINIKTDGVTTFSNVIGNRSANVVINGSDGNDSINNTGSNVVIYANYGNDTIINSAANVTINAGGGSETFVHAAGNNAVIYNYTSSQDRLQLAAGSILGSSLDGDDVKLFIDSDVVTFKDTKDKSITITDINGQTTSRVYGQTAVETLPPDTIPSDTVPSDTLSPGDDDQIPVGIKLNKAQTVLTVQKKFEGSLVDATDYSDEIVKINASSFKNPIELIGNDNDNIIKGSKGGSTLDGGDGNDKLYGNKKAIDHYVFDGQGNDIVYNYKPDQDFVHITEGEITDVSVKGSNVILTIDDESTLTIKSIAKKELVIIDADDVESTYKFTKQNNDLESALISTNFQLPSEEYWFEQDSAISNDELGEIISTDAPIDLNFDDVSDTFKPKLELATSARHWSKK